MVVRHCQRINQFLPRRPSPLCLLGLMGCSVVEDVACCLALFPLAGGGF